MRDFAMYSASLGSKGILEIDAPNTSSDYIRPASAEENGTSDDFYFSNVGYVPAQNSLGSTLLWASSLSSKTPYYSYVFNSRKGYVGIVRNTRIKLAVSCMISP